VDGEGSFFTVNVHFTSKGGSSSLHGDARPPVNGGVDQRERQADITARFVKQILDGDGDANVMVGGDFNEFATVQPLKTLAAVAGLRNQDDVNGLDEGEVSVGSRGLGPTYGC
jgi:predicted extracellular nuclease